MKGLNPSARLWSLQPNQPIHHRRLHPALHRHPIDWLGVHVLCDQAIGVFRQDDVASTSLVRPSSRDARFTASPMTVYSMRSAGRCCPRPPAPVCTPTPMRISGSPRASKPRSASAGARASRAPLYGVSGSSGLGTGAPNTAMMASPMNLSTTPSWHHALDHAVEVLVQKARSARAPCSRDAENDRISVKRRSR